MIENRLERGPTLLDADDARGHHSVPAAAWSPFVASNDCQLVQLCRMSGAAVDVALDGRADLGYQVLCPAVRQNRHPQHIAAHQQAQNLRCDQPARLFASSGGRSSRRST